MRNNGLNDFYAFFAFMFDASHLRKVDLSYQNTFLSESEELICKDYKKLENDTSAVKLRMHKMPDKRYCNQGDVCLMM